MDAMIEVQNVNKSFGEEHVLKDVSHNFETGKIHGIVGNNGSGKTVLMKCICGFLSIASMIKNATPTTRIATVRMFKKADEVLVDTQYTCNNTAKSSIATPLKIFLIAFFIIGYLASNV